MGYIFIVIVFGILFLFHWAVYLFFVDVFYIENRKMKLLLKFLLLVISLSFLFSSFFIHWQDNIFTKVFYVFSWFWLGLLVNLLMGIFLYYLVKFIHEKLNKVFKKEIISVGIIFAVLAYSLFGLWNALFPVIKTVPVKFENMSEELRNTKIVQISDVHLGKAMGVNFLKRVVEKVNSLDADIVVITGDLFDGIDGNLSAFIEDLNKIKSKSGVYYITGNHEIYLGEEEALATLAKTHIKVLNDEVLNIKGMQLIGVSYPKLNQKKDIKKIIETNSDFNPDLFNVLLYHSPTNIFSSLENNHNSLYWSPDVNFDAAKDLKIDLQLSGHTHKGQIFPFNFLTDFIYGGFDYGLHKDGYFNIYITSGTGVWGPTMRTGSRSEIVEIILE